MGGTCIALAGSCRERQVAVLVLKAAEVVVGGDRVAVDGDHAELPIIALRWEVAEGDTARPDVGHGLAEDRSDLCPETGRRRYTSELREVRRDVQAREVSVLAAINGRRCIAAPLTVKGVVIMRWCFPAENCASDLLVVQSEKVDCRRAGVCVRRIAAQIFSQREDPVVSTVDGRIANKGGRRDGVTTGMKVT